MNKYCPADKPENWGGYGAPDNKTVLEAMDDVANVKLKGNWRIPTEAEWVTLKSDCEWIRTTYNGVDGYKVISKKPGYENNWIFLPVTGIYGLTRYYDEAGGYYWTSSLKRDTHNYAWGVYLGPDPTADIIYQRMRIWGCAVRPVLE